MAFRELLHKEIFIFKDINRLILKKFGIGFVLYGHGVVHKRENDFVESLHMNFSEFDTIITYLQNYGYTFIDMSKMIEISHNGFAYPGHWVHLTFDDGYKNIKDIVLPYLASKGIPFTVFVSTNHIESRERFYTYRLRCALIHTQKSCTIPEVGVTLSHYDSLGKRKELYKKVREVFKNSSKTKMLKIISHTDSLLSQKEWKKYNDLYQADRVLTKEELKELSSHKLVTIGSHNANHIRLNACMTEDNIYHEMITSKKWIYDNLDIKGDLTYAYPSGTKNDYSELSMDICRITGYKLAFTTIHNYIESTVDLYEIPRFPFPKSLSKLKKIIFFSLF
jgi:peptidoglycan/xylan/chitin deacetylase (PgdA/CDA1 family)